MASIEGSLAQGVRWIINTAGQIVGYRNPETDTDETADFGGSGGGHVIEYEGTPVTQRANLNITGAGASVSDVGGKTVLNIPGASVDAAGVLSAVQAMDSTQEAAARAAIDTMSSSAIAAAIAAAFGGGSGQVTVLKPSTTRTMPAGGGTNYYASKITVPGGAVGANGAILVYVTTSKSGATDGVATLAKVSAGTATAFSSATTVATMSHGAGGRGLTGWFMLWGNGTDESSIKAAQSSGVDPTTSGNVVGNYITATLDASADWEIQYGGNCGTTDTVTVEKFFAVVFNPDAAAGGSMSGSAIEAVLDAYYGSTDWRTGGSAAGWQTVTPIAPDSTPVSLTYYVSGSAKPNIVLNPPVSASHVVQPCTDAPDGATYEILLNGGGASGLWQAYSGAAPTTHGFVWLSGAAPTSPASASYATRILVRRRGYRHEADVAGYDVEL